MNGTVVVLITRETYVPEVGQSSVRDVGSVFCGTSQKGILIAQYCMPNDKLVNRVEEYPCTLCIKR
jgi:hypothetical protein